MKDLLNAILNKLEEVTALKYIDEDWDQLNDFPNTAVKFPAALVDFQITNKSDFLNREQSSTYSIDIIVCHKKLSNSNRNAPESQKQKSFEIYEIVDEIHNKLHGWHPTADAGRMVDKSLSKEYVYGIKKLTMNFEVTYTKKVPSTMVPVQVGLQVDQSEN